MKTVQTALFARCAKRALAALLALSLAAGLAPAAPAPPGGAGGPPRIGASRAYAAVSSIRATNSMDAANLSIDWSYFTILATSVKSARATWVGRAADGSSSMQHADYSEPQLDASGAVSGYANISKAVLPLERFDDGILYQIKVEFFSDEACAKIIGEYVAETAFIKQLLSTATPVRDGSTRSVNPGEREAGYKPALEVAFQAPLVFVSEAVSPDPYDAGSGAFVPMLAATGSDSAAGYEAALAAIQRLDHTVDRIALALGVHQYIFSESREYDCMEVEFAKGGAPGYELTATVDFGGGVAYSAMVRSLPAGDNWFGLYLLGRQDEDTAFPDDPEWNYGAARAAYVPDGITEAGFPYALRHEEIYPGSAYHVHATLKYWNAAGNVMIESGAFRVTSRQFVSEAVTALRAILSKVSDEYVKAEIYRININRRRDYLIGNSYRAEQRSPTQTGLDPLIVVNVSDINDDRQTVQAYIRVTNPAMRYVYTALYVNAAGSAIASSMDIPFALNDAGASAPLTPKSLSIDKLAYDPVRKTTDVTVSWDKPDGWDAAPDSLYVEFLLNTSYLANADAAETLRDEDGNPLGTFTQEWKLALAVPKGAVAAAAPPTSQRLTYTIRGDALFRVVPIGPSPTPTPATSPTPTPTPPPGSSPAPSPATSPTPSPTPTPAPTPTPTPDTTPTPSPPTPLSPDALYPAASWLEERARTAVDGQSLFPDWLVANTRYFLMARTALWSEDASAPGGVARAESNPSLSAAFTTYPTRYGVPLPFEFGVSANEIKETPQGPSAYENSLSLWSSAVDWRYATTTHDPSIPVHYELYISDGPLKKPRLAGTTNDASFATWDDPAWGAGMLPPVDGAGWDAALLVKGAIEAPSPTSGLGRVAWDGVKAYMGKPLQPNRIYYFWLRTYIVEDGRIVGDGGFSIMLSATTRPYPQRYDDTHKRPLAPVDLAIAEGPGGVPLVGSDFATLEWGPTGEDVLFELIITSVRDLDRFMEAANAGPPQGGAAWAGDPAYPDALGAMPFGDPALAPAGTDTIYDSFIKAFDADDGSVDRRLILDPLAEGSPLALDPDTGKYRYRIARWLFPNSLYYVSVRPIAREGGPVPAYAGNGAIDAVSAAGAAGTAVASAVAPVGAPASEGFYRTLKNTGAFVTVPLTTLLLEAPRNLKAITGAELSFSFEDSAQGFRSEDYSVYIRKAGDAGYTQAGGVQGSVVRVGDAVYARVSGLEFNVGYDVRVMRGAPQDPAQAFEAQGLYTRDPRHTAEVEWDGPALAPDEPYLSYEVAVISHLELEELAPEEVEYFALSELDLLSHVWIVDGKAYPFAISESAATAADPGMAHFRAVLLSKPTRARNGAVERRPLAPNMRYYIKVRAKKAQPGDETLVAYSKYAGPVETRTDFSQEAQDEEEERARAEQNLLGIIEAYERQHVYPIDLGDMSENRMLMKEDKIAGLLRSSPDAGYVLDIGDNPKKAAADTIYIPAGIILALEDTGKTLTLRTQGAEYVFGRHTVDLSHGDGVAELMRQAGTQAESALVRVRASRAEFHAAYAPEGASGITGVHSLTVDVLASRRPYSSIKAIVDGYIYNGNGGDGLSRQMADAISQNVVDGYNTGDGGTEGRLRAADAYAAELASNVMGLVSYKVGDLIFGRNGYLPAAAAAMGLSEFGEPGLVVRLDYPRQGAGKVSPIVSEDGTSWRTLTRGVDAQRTRVMFSVGAPGSFAAISYAVSTASLGEGTKERASLESVASRFVLTDIFPGIDSSFRPSAPVLGKEAALLYERVLGLEHETFGLGVAAKVIALGLSDVIPPGTANAQLPRQRGALLLARMHSALAGAPGRAAVSAGRRFAPDDAADIDAACRAAVDLCLEKGYLALEGGSFMPSRALTRGELITAIALLP